MKNLKMMFMSLMMLVLGACAEDIPQAHRGQEFHMTGPLALWIGGNGFSDADPIMGPGTALVGYYDTIRLVECAETTSRESMPALTADGVQFSLDVYVRYSVSCDSDASVRYLLRNVVPETGKVISAKQVFQTYVRPALGEAVRVTVSPYAANDLNASREKILAGFVSKFREAMKPKRADIPAFLTIHDTNLSNMDFPDKLDNANVERAAQGILRDKAIAQMDVVKAETATMEMRAKLGKAQGEQEAARIRAVGAALAQYPQFLQFDLQTRMETIYRDAGVKGNLILAAPSPLMLTPGTRLGGLGGGPDVGSVPRK